jgi:hypothetical protein
LIHEENRILNIPWSIVTTLKFLAKTYKFEGVDPTAKFKYNSTKSANEKFNDPDGYHFSGSLAKGII